MQTDQSKTETLAAVLSSDLLCRVRALADALVTADPQLRVARNEEDATTEPQRESATFVKLNEKRIGRDLELYSFMAKMEGEQSTVARLLEELVLPLKKCAPKAFAAGITQLRAFDVFGEKQTEWVALLDDLAA